MSKDKQEEVVILFELFERGGKASKARVTRNIIEKGHLQAQPGDDRIRQGHETVLENDLAWARENLKEKGQLAMPAHGIWQITAAGTERLFRVARAIYQQKPDSSWFERYSQVFIERASALGKRLCEADAPALEIPVIEPIESTPMR